MSQPPDEHAPDTAPPSGIDPYGEPDGAKKRRLPLLLTVVGLLAVAGGVVLAVVLLTGGGGKGSTPQDTAQSFAEAFNDRDADGIQDLLCQADLDAIGKAKEDLQATAFRGVPEKAQITVDRIDTTSDTEAMAHFKATGATQNAPQGIPLRKAGDEWEVCFIGEKKEG